MVDKFDYVFAENGLVAYKDGKQIGQQVGHFTYIVTLESFRNTDVNNKPKIFV